MSSDGSPPAVKVNRSFLVGGGVLVGIGGFLGFTGMALVGSAMCQRAEEDRSDLRRPPCPGR